MGKNEQEKINRELFFNGECTWRCMQMKMYVGVAQKLNVMTIVDSGQQMSAVGQQALWSADHVIMSDKVKSEATAQ